MKQVFWLWIGLAGICLAATRKPDVLPEGLYLQGLQVALRDPCTGAGQTLQVESPMRVSDVEIPVGARWTLLPTHALQAITQATAQHAWRHWQLYGRLTVYRGQQYFYTERGRPIIPPVPKPNEPNTAEPNGLAEAANALGIPKNLVQRVNARSSTRIPTRFFPSDGRTDRVLVDRVGRLVQKNGQCFFRFESLGRREAGPDLRVLPSQIRQRLEQLQASDSAGLRFRIAALKTEYQGHTELLLLRAVRAYNYGNFGD